jgi:hypothetical protein
MSEPKTKPGIATVESFIESLDEDRQFDATTLIDIMEDVSGEKAVLWGANIVGFGSQAGWPKIAFSPRKGKISLYLTNDAEKYIPQLEALEGKYQIGKGCMYIRKVGDVDSGQLRALIQATYDDIPIHLPK